MEENIEELVSQCVSATQGSRPLIYKALIGKFTGSKGSEIKWKSSKETTNRLIEILQEDIISENFDISYDASGFLGCVLAKEDFIEKVDVEICTALLTSLLDAIEHHIEKKSDKRILIRGLWSLSNSMFKNEVYGANLKKIFFIINQVLGGHNEISSLAQLETLKAVLQLQDAIHSQMVKNCREYIQAVFRQLFSDHEKVRDVSYRCVYNLKNHMEQNPEVTQVLIPDLKNTYTKKMLRLVTNECSDVLRVWRLIVGLLGKYLHPGTSLINMLLEVVEKAFKSQQSMIRIDAFLCWQALMDNFSLDEKVITNPKRLKLLIAPLKVNNAKTEDIATAKLQAWWHLVVKLGKNAHSNFDLVVAPLLRFCFGTGSSSGIASGLSEQYLMKAGATSASPGRKFVGLHLLCAEILAQIISKGLDLDELMSCNMSIKSLTAPVLNSGQGFVHSHQLLFSCIKEAITSLNPNDRKHQILGVFIIQCVLGHLKVLLSSDAKPDTVEAVKALFMLISTLESLCRPGDAQSLFVYKFLEMVMSGSLALPHAVLNSRQYHISRGNTMKDMMNGTLCDHVIRQLCTPTMLHYATLKEGYFVIWESVLTNCNPSNGKLGFLQSVVSELDHSVAVLCPAHPAALVRLWGITATTLMHHIKETQNIDQGDSSEHDWSCVYAVLLFPLQHSADKLSSAERHHYHQIMKIWTQLWGQFVQLTPVVDTAEPNTEVEDMSSKFIDICKDKLTGPPDCHVSALELIADALHVMIECIRFSELGKTSAKLISSPAKPRKKPHVLKNLASSVELFCQIFPKVLRMTSERRQKISTQLINMAILIFDGIKKQEPMIKFLISPIAEVMHKAVQVNLTAVFGGDVETKFVYMWSKYCGLIEHQCKLDAEYADEHLTKFAPLFQVSLESANKGIKHEMWKLWKSSFADTGTSIPSSLYDTLKVAGLPPASLADTVSTLEDSLSNSPKENVPIHISGSFLNREKGNTGTPKFGTPKATPKVNSLEPLEETPKTRRNTIGTPLSRRKIKLQDMKDEEFVRVASPKAGRRVLTEHQAEKMKERRSDIPALYNDLSQSNSQLPLQFTTQHSVEESVTEKSPLMKTENLTANLEDLSFTGRILEETNSEDPIVEQFQEVNEDIKKSAKAKEKGNVKRLGAKHKNNENSKEIINENKNAITDDSIITITNKESDEAKSKEETQNETIEDSKPIDVKNKNKHKDKEQMEQDSKVNHSKKSIRGGNRKSKEKEVLQEIEDSEREKLKLQEMFKGNNRKPTEDSERPIEIMECEERKITRSGKAKLKEAESFSSSNNDSRETRKSKVSDKLNKTLEKDKINNKKSSNIKENEDKVIKQIEDSVKETPAIRKSRKEKLKEKEKSLKSLADKEIESDPSEGKEEEMKSTADNEQVSRIYIKENEDKVIKQIEDSVKETPAIRKSRKEKLKEKEKSLKSLADKEIESEPSENEDKVIKQIEDSVKETPAIRKSRKEKLKEKEKSLKSLADKEIESDPSEGKEEEIKSTADNEQVSTKTTNTEHKLIETGSDDQKMKNIENDELKDNKDNLNPSVKETLKYEELRSPVHRRKDSTPSKKSIDDIKNALKGPRSRNKVQYGEVVVSPSVVKDKKISTDTLSVKLSQSAIKKHMKNNEISVSESESESGDEIPSSQEIEVDTSSSRRSILNITRTPVHHNKGKRNRDVDSGPNEEPNDKKQCLEYPGSQEEIELANDLDAGKNGVTRKSVPESDESVTNEDLPIKNKRGRKSKKKSPNDATVIDDKINCVQTSKSERSQNSEDLFKSSNSQCSPKLTRSGRKVRVPNKDMPEPMTPPGKLSSSDISETETSSSKPKAKRSLNIQKPIVQKQITDIFCKEQKEIDFEDSESRNNISIDIHKLPTMADELDDSCIPTKDESTGESETSEKECEENMKSSEINSETSSEKRKHILDEVYNNSESTSEKSIHSLDEYNNQSIPIEESITGANDKERNTVNGISSIDNDITDMSLDTSGLTHIADIDINEKSKDTVIQGNCIFSEVRDNIDNLEEIENNEETGDCDHRISDSESEEENDTPTKFSNLKKDADLSSPSGRLNSSKELTCSPQKSTNKFDNLENLEHDAAELNDEFDIVVETDDLAERILRRQSLTISHEGVGKEEIKGLPSDKKDSIVSGSKSSSNSTGDSSLSSFESAQRVIDETPTPTDSSSLNSTEPEESSRPKPNIAVETALIQQMEEELSPEKISKSKFSTAIGTPERKKFAANKFTSSRAAMLVACAKQSIKKRSEESESPSKSLDMKTRLINSPSRKSSPLRLSPSNTPNRKRKYSEMGPAERRPWAKHKPSPGASPASSILKKRDECLDSSYAETPSPPPNKQRRVSFADPPVSEAVEIPPSPKTKGIRAQKKLDMTKAASPDKESHLYVEMNKLSSPVKETQESQTQTQEDMDAIAYANCTGSFYPNLLNCEDSIRQIADELTAPTLVEGLISLMKDKGIVTIGDLCRQSEADIHALPLRAPKHTITFSVLKKYEDRIRETMLSKHLYSSNERILCMGPDLMGDKASKRKAAGDETVTDPVKDFALLDSLSQEMDQQLIESVLSKLNSKNGKLLLSSIMSHLDHSTVMEVVCSYMYNTTRTNKDDNQ